MLRRSTAILVTGCFCFFLEGCTGKAWYEGMKDAQRQECYRIESPSDRLECLEKVDEATYDQYKRERDGSGKR